MNETILGSCAGNCTNGVSVVEVKFGLLSLRDLAPTLPSEQYQAENGAGCEGEHAASLAAADMFARHAVHAF